MSEQTETERRSLSSVLVWVLAGVVIGLALFAITLLSARPQQPNDAPPTTLATRALGVAAQQPAVAAIAPAAAASQPAQLITYTVKSGDVLGAIAEQFGISTQTILQANANTLTNPDQLQIGQLLLIPTSNSETAAQAQSAQSAQTTQPTQTPFPPSAMQKHVIARGEVLSTIAEKYGIPTQAIRTANNLSGDTIRAGDTLLIPVQKDASAAAPAKVTDYAFSILEGDLAQAYPLSESGSNFVVHYQPNSPAANEIQEIVAFLEQAQKSIVKSMGVRFTGKFEVYLAGSLFAPPNQALRGRAFSAKRTVFVLYDSAGNAAGNGAGSGAGSADERRYMLTHELTHLIAWNTYGPAKSAMLSEGAAVFAGEAYLKAGDFLPIRNFCLAYRRAERLPLVASSSLDFSGHLLSLDGYYASGCFVQYLLKTYGTAKFGKLYSSLDYRGVYGRTLDQLQRNWLATLDADKTRLPFTASELPTAYEALLKDYGAFFARIGEGEVDTNVYRDLDERRLNLLMGKF